MKLVVIGGVAGGASVAARARRLDESAEIVVLERSSYVSFANCGLPYHIGGVIRDRQNLLLQTPQSLRDSLNLDVRTGHEAVTIDRAAKRVRVRELSTGREYDEAYDYLALCPGASPVRPPLPGLDHPAVRVLRNIEDMDEIKRRVDASAQSAAVIGAGYIGVEMAENLRERGWQVDLVELESQILPPMDREMVASLEDHLVEHGVVLHLGTAAAAVRDAGGRAAVELRNGRTIEADLVILSVGVRPEVSLARSAGLDLGPRGGIRVDAHMRTSDPCIYAVGDAVEVFHTILPGSWVIPLAGPANRQARVAAENICGRNTTYESTQGTAIVKVFDLTAGSTGASEKMLQRAQIPYLKAYLHPSGHAGYYPGTAPMHIKLLFAPDSGRILGAQAVGYDGVDKRLDVFATALRAGMTVFDLEKLELAYAPPYGSAKDPVNMAGFVAANVIRGDLRLWYAEDWPKTAESAFLLDVRSPAEYEAWHLPGAQNIPLGTLRARLAQLPKDRPIRVYCKVGFRSYLAQRLLQQRGFPDVATLAGGVTTFRAWHREIAAPKVPQPATLSYAEEQMEAAANPPAVVGKVVEADCTGLQCPGPILRLKQEMDRLSPGDELLMRASDPGFPADVRAWCASAGNLLLALDRSGSVIEARIRKARPAASAAAPAADSSKRRTFVVFSGDLDRVLAAFVIANGTLAMGGEVSMFFTFWGLNALRKPSPPPVAKDFISRMFGWMLPRGASRLKLSQMHLMGAGTAMMRGIMRRKNIASLPDMIETARRGGARIIACTMSMDVMGLRPEELLDGIEFGGVGAFLGDSDRSRTTLFI